MTKRVTMPPLPWDPLPAANMLAEPAPPYVKRLIRDTFNGKLDGRDIKYMAMAMLQMSDEIFELRARIDALDMALIAKEHGDNTLV